MNLFSNKQIIKNNFQSLVFPQTTTLSSLTTSTSVINIKGVNTDTNPMVELYDVYELEYTQQEEINPMKSK